MENPELRRKILFTIAMLIVFRFGTYIPNPGLDADAFSRLVEMFGSLGSVVDIVSGGAFKVASIFAMEYHRISMLDHRTASDGCDTCPRKLQKEGRRSEDPAAVCQVRCRHTRPCTGSRPYFTVRPHGGIIDGGSVWSFLLVIFSFAAGTAFLMWLGEQITEHGSATAYRC